eukprot:TRINITY_DN45244_c0_g1_i1.p1 TRINITY_DN45244_c0_g1~~TRINITY_DN45244_c0_g1_i1.p1  ORF type:complete len:2327 (-),score=472.03 TRINITY_DN45244_c0_g1_i1:14-6646(-)
MQAGQRLVGCLSEAIKIFGSVRESGNKTWQEKTAEWMEALKNYTSLGQECGLENHAAGQRVTHVLKGGAAVLQLLILLPSIPEIVRPAEIKDEMWHEFQGEKEIQGFQVVRRGKPSSHARADGKPKDDIPGGPVEDLADQSGGQDAEAEEKMVESLLEYEDEGELLRKDIDYVYLVAGGSADKHVVRCADDCFGGGTEEPAESKAGKTCATLDPKALSAEPTRILWTIPSKILEVRRALAVTVNSLEMVVTVSQRMISNTVLAPARWLLELIGNAAGTLTKAIEEGLHGSGVAFKKMPSLPPLDQTEGYRAALMRMHEALEAATSPEHMLAFAKPLGRQELRPRMLEGKKVVDLSHNDRLYTSQFMQLFVGPFDTNIAQATKPRESVFLTLKALLTPAPAAEEDEDQETMSELHVLECEKLFSSIRSALQAVHDNAASRHALAAARELKALDALLGRVLLDSSSGVGVLGISYMSLYVPAFLGTPKASIAAWVNQLHIWLSGLVTALLAHNKASTAGVHRDKGSGGKEDDFDMLATFEEQWSFTSTEGLQSLIGDIESFQSILKDTEATHGDEVQLQAPALPVATVESEVAKVKPEVTKSKQSWHEHRQWMKAALPQFSESIQTARTTLECGLVPLLSQTALSEWCAQRDGQMGPLQQNLMQLNNNLKKAKVSMSSLMEALKTRQSAGQEYLQSIAALEQTLKLALENTKLVTTAMQGELVLTVKDSLVHLSRLGSMLERVTLSLKIWKKAVEQVLTWGGGCQQGFYVPAEEKKEEEQRQMAHRFLRCAEGRGEPQVIKVQPLWANPPTSLHKQVVGPIQIFGLDIYVTVALKAEISLVYEEGRCGPLEPEATESSLVQAPGNGGYQSMAIGIRGSLSSEVNIGIGPDWAAIGGSLTLTLVRLSVPLRLDLQESTAAGCATVAPMISTMDLKLDVYAQLLGYRWKKRMLTVEPAVLALPAYCKALKEDAFNTCPKTPAGPPPQPARLEQRKVADMIARPRHRVCTACRLERQGGKDNKHAWRWKCKAPPYRAAALAGLDIERIGVAIHNFAPTTDGKKPSPSILNAIYPDSPDVHDHLSFVALCDEEPIVMPAVDKERIKGFTMKNVDRDSCLAVDANDEHPLKLGFFACDNNLLQYFDTVAAEGKEGMKIRSLYGRCLAVNASESLFSFSSGKDRKTLTPALVDCDSHDENVLMQFRVTERESTFQLRLMYPAFEKSDVCLGLKGDAGELVADWCESFEKKNECTVRKLYQQQGFPSGQVMGYAATVVSIKTGEALKDARYHKVAILPPHGRQKCGEPWSRAAGQHGTGDRCHWQFQVSEMSARQAGDSPSRVQHLEALMQANALPMGCSFRPTLLTSLVKEDVSSFASSAWTPATQGASDMKSLVKKRRDEMKAICKEKPFDDYHDVLTDKDAAEYLNPTLYEQYACLLGEGADLRVQERDRERPSALPNYYQETMPAYDGQLRRITPHFLLQGSTEASEVFSENTEKRSFLATGTCSLCDVHHEGWLGFTTSTGMWCPAKGRRLALAASHHAHLLETKALLERGVAACVGAENYGIPVGAKDTVAVCDEAVTEISDGHFRLEGYIVVGPRQKPRDIMADAYEGKTKIYRYAMRSDMPNKCATALLQTVEGSEDEMALDPHVEKETTLEAFPASTLQAIRTLWLRFWLELAEFQDFYSECRLEGLTVQQRLRDENNFAPLRCVFQKMVATKTSEPASHSQVVLSDIPHSDPPPIANQRSGCYALDKFTSKQQLSGGKTMCTAKRYVRIPMFAGPQVAFKICQAAQAGYAGLAADNKRGDILVWCCLQRPERADAKPASSCALPCFGNGTASEKQPQKMCMGHKAHDDKETTVAVFHIQLKSKTVHTGYGKFADGVALARQREKAIAGSESGAAQVLGQGVSSAGSPTWACPPYILELYKERRSGGCWPCSDTIESALSDGMSCWQKNKDAAVRSDITKARQNLGLITEAEASFFDRAQSEAALLAVTEGSAPFKAKWYTCDEGVINTAEDDARKFIGGVLCWVGDTAWTGSRGCLHWLGAAPAKEEQKQSERRELKQCAKAGELCHVQKDGLVQLRLRINPDSDEYTALEMISPAEQDIPCDAATFSSVKELAVIGCWRSDPVVQSPAAGDSAKASDGATEDIYDAQSRSMKMGVKIAPMAATTGNADYLYMFDKVRSTHLSRQGPECAAPPQADDAADDQTVAFEEM